MQRLRLNGANCWRLGAIPTRQQRCTRLPWISTHSSPRCASDWTTWIGSSRCIRRPPKPASQCTRFGTTPLRTVMGLLKPSQGAISFDNGDVSFVSPHAKATEGLVLVTEGRQSFRRISGCENLPPRSLSGHLRRTADACSALKGFSVKLSSDIAGRATL